MTKERKLIPYLLWSFGIAWVLQLAACWFFSKGNSIAYQMILMVSMFAPLLAVLLSKSGVKELGWRPQIKKNWKFILLAWLLPMGLAVVGAALYFVIFPAAFDTSCNYVAAQLGDAGIAELEAQGLTLQLYGIISAVQALTWAPFVNMIAAMGEEAGWRGVMYPELKNRLGTVKGRIFGGIIWGAWHWPIMILSGYEYGTGYWGEPVSGMVIFCIFTIAAGILLDWLYEKTNCIWVPSLGHGAINAAVGVPTFFLNTAYANNLLVGPLMNGIIGGLPLIAVAAIISWKKNKADKSAFGEL